MTLSGIPWQSNGEDSTLPLLRAGDQSLIRELRSHELCGQKKKKKKRQYTEKHHKIIFFSCIFTIDL